MTKISNQKPRQMLRWAGSKKSLFPVLVPLIENEIGNRRYVELFAGSASLLYSLTPKRSFLNDVNKDLVDFYRVLKKEPIELFQSVNRLGGKENYYEVRDADISDYSQLQRAARFFYLNRLCFNGIYRTNKSGKFNVPIGSNMGSFPKENDFLIASKLLRCTKITCGDYQKSLKHIEKNDFIFLDPPYALPSRRDSNEYGANSFQYSDLNDLINFVVKLDELKVPFVLCYQFCDELLSALKEFNILTLSIGKGMRRRNGVRSMLRECIVKNF